jgi:hypothetical protein
MTADWIVQDPSISSSLNRYLYVWNNPINATDPTGNIGNFRIGSVLSDENLDNISLANFDSSIKDLYFD